MKETHSGLNKYSKALDKVGSHWTWHSCVTFYNARLIIG